MIIEPGSIPTKDFHAYLLSAVAPRPICFASTLDEDGNANLSPFSFFNAFGSKPPIVIFSPARRVRDNTTKHSLQNAEALKEVVIAVVNYNMVQQVSLASCEYPKGVDEFVKAGFTKGKAEKVKPYLVQESPVNLECKVLQIIKTGDEGGAANLIICEVVKMHIKDEILDEENRIDPNKIDLVARMGQDFYCRASGDAVFEVPKPNTHLGMGMDTLPLDLLKSEILTGNDLGMLANATQIPEKTPLQNADLEAILQQNFADKIAKNKALHFLAHQLLEERKVAEAWQVLLCVED